MGRKSLHPNDARLDELFDEIVDFISENSLRKAFEHFEITARAWGTYLVKNPEKLALVDRVREFKAEVIADDCIDIADKGYDANLIRERTANRWRWAQSMHPKKFGERSHLDVNLKETIDLTVKITGSRSRLADYLAAAVPALSVPKEIQTIDLALPDPRKDYNKS